MDRGGRTSLTRGSVLVAAAALAAGCASGEPARSVAPAEALRDRPCPSVAELQELAREQRVARVTEVTGADEQLVPPGRIDALLVCAAAPGAREPGSPTVNPPRVVREYVERPGYEPPSSPDRPDPREVWARLESGSPSVTAAEDGMWVYTAPVLALVTHRYADGGELDRLDWHPVAAQRLDGVGVDRYARRSTNGRAYCVFDDTQPPLNRRCSTDPAILRAG